jgi:hypothetical protein
MSRARASLPPKAKAAGSRAKVDLSSRCLTFVDQGIIILNKISLCRNFINIKCCVISVNLELLRKKRNVSFIKCERSFIPVSLI